MRWILFLLICLPTYAQKDPFLQNNRAQSPSNLNWLVLENDYVEVLFPEGYEGEAQRSAHFVKNYAQVVGQSLGISRPQKFPLILRPKVALPNGFVALAPRRSEWFIHQSFSPLIGGLDFMDALAIHEYRHINQFDFSYRKGNRIGYFLFGELGLAVLNVIGMPNWYWEGDAVWSETVFTKGGRGRSPRFHARLKGLILSNQIPTYDELVGDTYQTDLPNHYVYGYYIVARAYKLYGPDFWQKVFEDVTRFSLNPYRIYSKFEKHSGVPFEQFVTDTFEELKREWEKEGDSLAPINEVDFVARRYPILDQKQLYFIERELNGYWTLRTKDKVHKELPLFPDISKVDLLMGKLIYTQVLPGLRFSYDSENAVFMYDIAEDETTRLSYGKNLYHPQWSPSGIKIAAVEKGSDGKWLINTLDMSEGKVLEWKSSSFSLGNPVELTFIDESHLAILFLNSLGEKAIARYSLETTKTEKISGFSRNNLFSLRSYDGGLLFEADWEGKVQAFYYKDQKTYQCSFEPIMVRNPSAYDQKLFYMSEKGNGEVLKETSFSDCKRLKKDIFSQKEDKGNFAVGIHQREEPVAMNLENRKNEEVKEVNIFFKGLSPNSWSFIGGRGYQLEVTGANYLGDFSYLARVGEDAEEAKPFGDLSLSYNRFFVSTTLYTSFEERNTLLPEFGGDVEWNEWEYGLSFKAPMRWVSGLYNGSLTLGLNVGRLEVSDRYGIYRYRANDETLNFIGGEFTFGFLKTMTLQEIYPRYGILARAFHRTLDSDRRSSYGTDVTFLEASLFLPGAFENHGLRLRGTYESQDDGVNNYRHDPIGEAVNSYVFSRGYRYFYVDEYTKASVDYAFPLINADLNFWGIQFLRRLSFNAFYDTTNVRVLSSELDLESFGGELSFDVKLFRRLPLVYGVRYSKLIDRDQDWDFFINTQLGF